MMFLLWNAGRINFAPKIIQSDQLGVCRGEVGEGKPDSLIGKSLAFVQQQ